MSLARRRFVATGTAVLTGLAGLTLAPQAAQGAPAPEVGPEVGGARYDTKTPTSTGFGGAVSSVDPEASRIGIQVLRRGGNAVDAAVATAAALGVTEPYSAGIGGGGYFVYYNARTGRVSTLDGRETAPLNMRPDAFIDPATGLPHPFADTRHQRRSRSARRAPWPPGRAPCRSGAPPACAGRCGRRPGWRTAASWWTRTFNKQTADNQ